MMVLILQVKTVGPRMQYCITNMQLTIYKYAAIKIVVQFGFIWEGLAELQKCSGSACSLSNPLKLPFPCNSRIQHSDLLLEKDDTG